jgi:hypothetical protein
MRSSCLSISHELNVTVQNNVYTYVRELPARAPKKPVQEKSSTLAGSKTLQLLLLSKLFSRSPLLVECGDKHRVLLIEFARS